MVYLDFAASAPMREEAIEAERDYESRPWAGANPNSLHTLGREASSELDRSRSTLARLVGGNFRPSDVTFTSGGTESNNLAIIGLAEGARAKDGRKSRVLFSSIEHDSILDLVGPLRDRGFDVALVGPGRDGVVGSKTLGDVMDDDVALVSVMAANNETGVIQPIDELARKAHAAGALFHTDAVQGFGRVPLELDAVDAVSIAAHKIGGPVGIGALVVRGRSPLRPQLFGGGQEMGRRPGTQDVRSAVAFSAAAAACMKDLACTREQVAGMSRGLYRTLCADGTGIEPTTGIAVGEDRLPGMVSIMVPGLESESLILRLDAEGFEVSAGSACSSGSLEPSHVLTAMGIERDSAFGSLRISFDERVPQKDLDHFSDTLIGIVHDMLGEGHGRR
jgi:cysteine desulfurase